MNTKSFVNQLDADNVVKGYYDESDQLVMVEPEGSGGGGDAVKNVTFKLTTESANALTYEARYALYRDGVLGCAVTDDSLASGEDATIQAAGAPQAMVEIKFSGEKSISITPSDKAQYIEEMNSWLLSSAKDCTLTITVG